MSDSETKQCPLCAETIRREAKKCPHCQSRQTRWPFSKQDLLLIFNVLIYCIFAVWLLQWALPHSLNENYTQFAKHKDDLVVSRVTTELARVDPEKWFGRTRAKNPASFTNGLVEVRFLDAHDNVVEHLDNFGSLNRHGISILPPDVWVSGYITNQSTRDWEADLLEIRVLDTRGQICEVERSSLSPSLVILSHHEIAFRTQVSGAAFTNKNNSLVVRVDLANEH